MESSTLLRLQEQSQIRNQPPPKPSQKGRYVRHIPFQVKVNEYIQALVIHVHPPVSDTRFEAMFGELTEDNYESRMKYAKLAPFGNLREREEWIFEHKETAQERFKLLEEAEFKYDELAKILEQRDANRYAQWAFLKEERERVLDRNAKRLLRWNRLPEWKKRRNLPSLDEVPYVGEFRPTSWNELMVW